MSDASLFQNGESDPFEDAMQFYVHLEHCRSFLSPWEMGFMEERVDLDSLPPFSSLSPKQQDAVVEILDKLQNCDAFEHALARDG